MPSSDKKKVSGSQVVQKVLPSYHGTVHSQYYSSFSSVRHYPWPLQSTDILSFLQLYREVFIINNNGITFRVEIYIK